MCLQALAEPAPDPNDDSDNKFHGYLERPARDFPSDTASWVRWVYIVDLDNDTFYVGIPDMVRRIFQLRHVIRSLFDPTPTPTGEKSEFDDCRVLLDDLGVQIRGGKIRHFLARHREVIISAEIGQFRPIYRVVLRRPDGGTIELQLQLVGIAIHKSTEL